MQDNSLLNKKYNSKCLLSIIIPFYNVEKYIRECVESLLNQNLNAEKYEVIFVDDCSIDQSREILNTYLPQFKNIRIITHEKNQLQGAARNTGLRNSTGEYVWFIDADDFIQPNILEKLIETAIKNKLDILHFNAQRVDESGMIKEYYANFPFNTKVISGIDYYEFDFPFWKRLIEMWCRIYKRDFLIKNNLFFPEGIFFEDATFTLKSILLSRRFQYINEIYYNYRINPESTMTRSISNDGKKMADLIRFHIECIIEINQHNLSQKTKDEITGFYLNLFLNNRINVFYLTNKERVLFYQAAKNLKLNIINKYLSSYKYIIYTESTLFRLILNIVSPPLRFLRISKRRLFKN